MTIVIQLLKPKDLMDVELVHCNKVKKRTKNHSNNGNSTNVQIKIKQRQRATFCTQQHNNYYCFKAEMLNARRVAQLYKTDARRQINEN